MNRGGGNAIGDEPGTLAATMARYADETRDIARKLLPRYGRPDDPAAFFLPRVPRLDLGSGPKPREGYVGVDRIDGNPDVLPWDFTSWKAWPFASETIEALASSHCIEHLPPLNGRGQDVLVRFFEEAWRICKPGALFHLRWPVPFDPRTGAPLESAWWDPTHYRRIPYQQLSYFSKQGRAELDVPHYDFRCNWEPVGPIGVRDLTEDGRVQEYIVELRREPL